MGNLPCLPYLLISVTQEERPWNKLEGVHDFAFSSASLLYSCAKQDLYGKITYFSWEENTSMGLIALKADPLNRLFGTLVLTCREVCVLLEV